MKTFTTRNAVGPGLWIALYGPDGAGKSAVTRQLRLALAPYFAGVPVHHLRLSLRGTRPQTAPVTQPHAQLPRGLALSYLKLIYMFAHGWLSHLLLTVPCRAAGQLVIFDRYFLDYAVDPRRYRLGEASVRLASLLGRFAPQPDLQFVLDVPADELQARKSEVSLSESARQRREYMVRLGALPNAVVVNADRPVVEVADEIVSGILRFAWPATDGPAETDLANA
jgi:thymidylate kinase